MEAAQVIALLSLALTGPTDPSASSCEPTHAGMRCVPAQKATAGEGWSKRRVKLERFFIDDAPVSWADLAACVDDGACVAHPGAPDAAPATPALVDWPRAERYCAFAGKRLPTEPEWQTAVAAGLAGEGREWTKTWFVKPSKCRKRSADLEEESDGTWARALCGSVDRVDACDGAVLCGKVYRRVVKDFASPGKRRGQNAWPDKRAIGFRCATSKPWLTRYPARATTTPLARPPVPTPPSADELSRFSKIREDDLDIPECEEPGRAYLECRDPRSYLKTNEPLLGVVLPYVRNRGGGYAGVGSDQNYTLIAEARSSWAWLFDYDENVVRWHHVLRALILAAPDRHAFVAFFEKDNLKRGREVIGAAYAKRAQRQTLQGLYRGAAPPLASHYRRLTRDEAYAYSWLGDDERYAYIRTLYLQGRMQAFKGNMLDKNTMRSIGKAARALEVPIRVYYPSNAPEFWELTERYRENVRGLPFDDETVVVQTISGVSMKTGFGQKGYWHYNVQHGLAQQELLLLPGITRHRQLLYHRVKTDSPELTLTDMPSASPARDDVVER
jgi:hypothetical protein